MRLCRAGNQAQEGGGGDGLCVGWLQLPGARDFPGGGGGSRSTVGVVRGELDCVEQGGVHAAFIPIQQGGAVVGGPDNVARVQIAVHDADWLVFNF